MALLSSSLLLLLVLLLLRLSRIPHGTVDDIYQCRGGTAAG